MGASFKVGDKAVYPSHGVVTIKCIESQEIGGSKQDFYVLQIISSGATLKVPVTASRSGLRGLISEKEIKNVYCILKSPGHVSRTTWNRRFREFSDKLKTGSVSEIAEVLRDLNSLQGDKDLSFGEKDMMRKAKDRIIKEISAASCKELPFVESELNKILQVSN
jgi:CarD family transcriptional regulator